jgi:predicted transcriptional regulator
MFHTSGRKALTALEQLVMDYVWAHPDCSAEACREGIAEARALKDSTIRTVLRKLEEKGYATHTVVGRTYVYRPADSKRNAAVDAARQLIERFCNGSVEDFVVGLVDNQVLDARQLQRVADSITAQKEGRS